MYMINNYGINKLFTVLKLYRTTVHLGFVCGVCSTGSLVFLPSNAG